METYIGITVHDESRRERFVEVHCIVDGAEVTIRADEAIVPLNSEDQGRLMYRGTVVAWAGREVIARVRKALGELVR